jgi:hypothetical protein
MVAAFSVEGRDLAPRRTGGPDRALDARHPETVPVLPRIRFPSSRQDKLGNAARIQLDDV